MKEYLRLIVRFCVCNSLLAVTSVSECEAQGAHVPVDVLLLFEPLDVQVGNCHGQSVVESYSTQAELDTQCRHATHVLCDGDAVGVKVVQHLIGKHEVYHALLINVGAEVLVVSTTESRANSVVGVEHGSHTVKAEAVKSVLIHPETQVGKQETQNLVVSVVEQPTIPEFVTAFGALVEVEVVGVVEHVQPVRHILRRVRVNHVQQDCDTHAVCSVNQLLEFVRSAIATAGGEEAVDLVAERSVVGVLHDGHELDDVVSEVLDAWKYILCELLVRRDLGIRAGDTDVCLVDPGALGLWRPLVLPLVLCWRVPEAGIVYRAHVQVLCDSLDPCGNPLGSGMVVWHNHADLDLAVMLNGGLSVNRRESDLEHTICVLFHLMAVAVPIVEVADQVCAQSAGGPLAVCDCVVGCDGEAEALVAARELFQSTFFSIQLLDPFLSF